MRYAKFNRVNGSVLRLLRQLSYLQSVYFRGAIMLDFFPPVITDEDELYYSISQES